MTSTQNESHDWLGEAAEKYVAYLLSKEKGFSIAQGSKWGVDIIVRDLNSKSRDKIWAFEVRSTDRNKTPRKPSSEKIKEKRVDYYAEVKKSDFLRVKIYRIQNNNKTDKNDFWEENSTIPLRKFLEGKSISRS